MSFGSLNPYFVRILNGYCVIGEIIISVSRIYLINLEIIGFMFRNTEYCGINSGDKSYFSLK